MYQLADLSASLGQSQQEEVNVPRFSHFEGKHAHESVISPRIAASNAT
jgi:hypothetical protein